MVRMVSEPPQALSVLKKVSAAYGASTPIMVRMAREPPQALSVLKKVSSTEKNF
jgi:hypothetical protein